MNEIHVYLTGRLGNQLFQYAFARRFQKQYGGKIICNVYDLEHRSQKMKHIPYKFSYDMVNYKLNENVQIEDEKPAWFADLYHPVVRVLKKVCPKLYFKILSKKGYLVWQSNDYIDIPKLKCDSLFLNGWWQNFQFFHEVEKELSDEIVPTTPCVEANQALYNVAQNTNSVCISIRGGNYLFPNVKKKLFVCDNNYFYEAVEIMLKKLDKPEFIIFSDDLNWVREYINFEKRFPNVRFFYETGTDSVEEKIRLMTMCKNFIISNSTFSWWAQYLSKNKNKIVIAPNAWFTNGKKIGLYMDNWLLIDVMKNKQS